MTLWHLGVGGAVRVAVLLFALCYGWWLSGLSSFTLSSDLAVGVPGVALVVLALWARPAALLTSRPSALLWRYLPAIVLIVAAIALEALGLAAGGRSSSWPTLSHLIDRPLVSRAGRFAVFELWLALGCTRALARGGFAR
jgi:hypothetical protein